MANKRVTVILTEEEYAHVCKKAGLIPLSAWFRGFALNGVKERCNEKLEPLQAQPNKAEEERGGEAVQDLRASDIQAGGAHKARTCVHGVAKGWRCWQCRGIAVIA